MYCTVETLKTYLGVEADADDALLGDLIGRASAAVDALCNRTFAADADSTRAYDALLDVDGRTLLLDRDLCAVTSVVNGDDATIGAGEWVLWPRTGPPWSEVRLRRGSNVTWTYEDGPEGAIRVTGRWAYSSEPPADVVQATVRLAAWFYRQKDIGYEPARPTFAGVRYSSDLPADVVTLLAPYRRLAL
jgi:hypothetical protein